MVKISAGSYDLNTWLHGGYESEVVTVFYGGAGSGKTNFCLQAAVSQAKKNNKVVYIDSEGGFSSERVKQLAGGEIDYKSILSNIFVLKPTSFSEQKEIFKNLNKYLKDEVTLLIVDGMTILYRFDMAVAREKGEEEFKILNTILVEQIKTLVEIARKRNIVVLITNQVYRWEDDIKMVGGDILKYWCKCLIELVNEKGKRVAHLRKHRSLVEKSLDFIITDSGIKKRGWL